MSDTHKKISGIILAAGSGSRMGKTKQLLPFGDTTILGRVIQNTRDSRLYETIVVLGHDADKISQALDFSGTRVVLNPAFAKGQSTSLIKGVEMVSLGCDAGMFILGDQPLVTFPLINQLIDAFETTSAPIVIPFYKGIRGNPVIITRSLFPRLTALSADTGARVIFEEFKQVIQKVPFQDDAILIDVDTMDDYNRLISKNINS